MILTRDKIQRMIGTTAGGSVSYSGGGGGGTMVAGVTPAYYNQNFALMYKTVVVVTDGGEVISTTTTFATAAPNEIVAVGTTSETDSDTGYVTTTTVSLVGPQAQNAMVIGYAALSYDATNNVLSFVNRDGVTPTSISYVNNIFQHGNYFLMNSASGSYGLMIEGMGYNLGTGVAKATFGFHTASSSGAIAWYNNGFVMQLYQDANDRRLEVDKIRIGGASGIDIAYDSGNNALKIVRSDGVSETAANLYATGGVSALGFSAGTSSVDSFAFNYLTVNNRLTFANNASIYGYGLNFVRNSASTDSPITLFYGYATSKTSSLTYYYTQYDKVGLCGNNANSDTWWIDPDGCARFTRLYLDGTRYLHISGTSLKYYNGSSDITIG